MRVYYYTKSKYGLQAIKDQRIKVSRFDDLNDPLELFGAEFSHKAFDAKFREFIQEFSQHIGLVCFGKTLSEIVLWAYYGDKHKGIALEFEISDNILNHEIKYDAHELADDLDNKYQNGEKPSIEDIERLCFTKLPCWSHENEIRILTKDLQGDGPDKKGCYFCSFENGFELKGIICGALCDLKKEDVASALLPGRQIDFVQAKLSFKKGEIVEISRETLQSTAT